MKEGPRPKHTRPVPTSKTSAVCDAWLRYHLTSGSRLVPLTIVDMLILSNHYTASATQCNCSQFRYCPASAVGNTYNYVIIILASAIYNHKIPRSS